MRNNKTAESTSVSTYVEHLRRFVAWADVGLAAEWADRDRVLVECRQVVGEGSVHVTHTVELRWDDAGEAGDETRAKQRVEQVLAGVEVRNDDTFAVVDARQRDVKLAIDSEMSVFR